MPRLVPVSQLPNYQITQLPIPQYPNYQFPLNPTLARKDFPSKGLARYKKWQGKRNNYIRDCSVGAAMESRHCGKAAPIQQFGKAGGQREFGYSRAVSS